MNEGKQGESLMGESKNKHIGMMALVILVSTLLLVGMFSGCTEQNGDEEKTVSIKGSSTVLPIAEACAEEFMKDNDVQITVSGGGSSVGIKAVAEGTVDIGDASRAAKPSDVEDIDGVDFDDLVDNVVAYDGIAIVVSKDVYDANVTNLTMDQVYKIYAGEISNWNELGGPDKEIFVNDRATTSGTRAAFLELVTNSTGYALDDFEEDGGKIAEGGKTNQENANVVTSIKNDDAGIGYVGLGYIDEDTCPALEIDEIYPSLETVLDGTYPISRSLHMYTLGEPTGAVKDFIDYVQSDAGQQIVEDEGFVPLPESERSD